MEYTTGQLHFLGIQTRLKVGRVYRENTSDSWDIPWYTTRKRVQSHKKSSSTRPCVLFPM